MHALEALSQTAIVIWVAESDWGYPVVLTLHSIGMALVVGIAAMFNLRMLGAAKAIPSHAFDAFFRVAWCGLAINVVSGSLLFCANYRVFLNNTAFITKLALLASAALVTWWLARQRDSVSPLIPSRVLSALSLVLLLGAMTAGRIIGYTSVPE